MCPVDHSLLSLIWRKNLPWCQAVTMNRVTASLWAFRLHGYFTCKNKWLLFQPLTSGWFGRVARQTWVGPALSQPGLPPAPAPHHQVAELAPNPSCFWFSLLPYQDQTRCEKSSRASRPWRRLAPGTQGPEGDRNCHRVHCTVIIMNIHQGLAPPPPVGLTRVLRGEHLHTRSKVLWPGIVDLHAS